MRRGRAAGSKASPGTRRISDADAETGLRLGPPGARHRRARDPRANGPPGKASPGARRLLDAETQDRGAPGTAGGKASPGARPSRQRAAGGKASPGARRLLDAETQDRGAPGTAGGKTSPGARPSRHREDNERTAGPPATKRPRPRSGSCGGIPARGAHPEEWRDDPNAAPIRAGRHGPPPVEPRRRWNDNPLMNPTREPVATNRKIKRLDYIQGVITPPVRLVPDEDRAGVQVAARRIAGFRPSSCSWRTASC